MQIGNKRDYDFGTLEIQTLCQRKKRIGSKISAKAEAPHFSHFGIVFPGRPPGPPPSVRYYSNYIG
jgi:hypothetical protein